MRRSPRATPAREATPEARATGAGLLGALGSPGVRTVVLYAATVGVGFGAVELAMPAFAEEHGARELGGVALVLLRGSLVGGLVAGMRPAGDLRRFLGGGVALAAALLALQLAVSLPTLCVLAFVAGLPIAPTVGALYSLIDRSARTGTAEAFALVRHCVSVGIATGFAGAGAPSTNGASGGLSPSAPSSPSSACSWPGPAAARRAIACNNLPRWATRRPSTGLAERRSATVGRLGRHKAPRCDPSAPREGLEPPT